MTKNVFITGASSGFGELISKTLLSNGFHVMASMRGLNGKNKEKANQLVEYSKNTRGKLSLYNLDVTNDQSVREAVEKAINDHGNIDVLINNAGIGSGGVTEAFSIEQFKQLFDINLFGVQRVTQAVLPNMRKNGEGLIINISSIMGRITIPFSGIYTASKYALEGLTESYRYELAATGVDVVIIEPGGFGTSFGNNMLLADKKDVLGTYGDIANYPEKMWKGFLEQLNSENGPDPQLVADEVLNVIELPAGNRKLRYVVDPMNGGEGPKTVNNTTDQIQAGLLKALGMADLVSVKAQRVEKQQV